MEISRFEKAAIKRTAQNTKALRIKRDKLQVKAEALITEIEMLQSQIEAFDAPWKTKYGMSVEEIMASWNGEPAPVAEEAPVQEGPHTEEDPDPFNL